ncbi:alpha/beta hydrolase [Nakamurella aerolata]|uniref:Esterase n=1 Tax=Nakamurella aerolata TaxID=1656892 RepID=A0A849A2Q4_9ACTN|nr:alpha/beta hydrolase-fold protein [Nakamurella aerolata]NNG34357.1 esterase [Nakamurella aerolata]
MASIRGDLVTQSFGYDGGRQVTVYRPAERPEAIVYAGDGQLISGWGGVLEAADVQPTMIVGVHRTDDPDEMARLAEYSPAIAPERFAAHEKFFVDEVGEWVRGRLGVTLPAGRTAVCGVSAGAELALAMGIRHPHRFGVVFAASPGGGYRPRATLAGRLPRAYLVAGTLEPWFAENAARWADALRAAGADVVLTEREGDHGDPFWQNEFPLMVRWAFTAPARQQHEAE